MQSSLTWIDHDANARERSLRILALFQERESRDELGLGGIRDTFADRLFPGTSTIQTRLRYMLFVPWIYRALEKRRIAPGEFARRADTAERDLIDALRNSDEREVGVLGGRSGRHLKRLPSSVYWSGLGLWGIRVADLSRDLYHRQIGVIYRRRAEQAERDRERLRTGDDCERIPEPGTLTWHPRLPPTPKHFPHEADFNLTTEEASFLLDCVTRSHRTSLLAHLALHCDPADVDAPWLHPDLESLTSEHQELLDHARRFSELMHGAALVYNIALARERSWDEQIDKHSKALETWANHLNRPELGAWSLPRLWELTMDYGHTITPATRHFVKQWVNVVGTGADGIGDNPVALDLVRHREESVKTRARSRFTNRRALDQWSGSSGLGRMTYRWATANAFLHDLRSAL